MSDKPVNQIVSRMIQSEGFDGYYAIPKHIQRATHMVVKGDGSTIELTPADKSVIYYMIEKVGFHNSGDRQMFESMTTIAYELGMSDRTVSRSVKKLIDAKVLIAHVPSKGKGYVYTDVDVSQQFVTMTSDDQKKRMVPNPINVEAPVKPVEAVTESNPDDVIPEWTTEAVDAPQTVRDDIEDHEHYDRHVSGSDVFDFSKFD